MEVISVNAERELLSLASIIGRSPESWAGWNCIQIVFDDLNENLQHECLFWAKSLVEAYIKDTVGRIYFCENKALHIFAKHVSFDVMKQAAQQICALVYSESSVCVRYKLFSLDEGGITFAQNVLGLYDNILGIGGYDTPHSFPSESFSGHYSMPDVVASDQALSSSSCKVLLVEDDTVTRWMVSQALKGCCELATAHSASNAFSVYSIFQPDVVFLDIGLPDQSGYEVLNWILNNDPGACVVMFSGSDHIDNVANALERGASGFISKPFKKSQLIHYIPGRA